MKKTFMMRIGLVFLTGSVLAVVPAAVQAADHDLYDSLKELTDSSRMQMYGSKDVYDSMEPTAAGAQGPVRSDMYKDGKGYTSSYGASPDAWDQLRMQLGPIGGEGTN
ncbi:MULTISPECIES: hypothetical protein [Zoogloea]|jgi:hypothetical protein|uniref:DUF4148 domain-containing protein n=1 Tax=Zoogloea oleivorans TaxID=1552750 RepID=A0A6C2D6D4_9RHOO|nr:MULTISPECIES: hypothetical protein [Zoogloea]MBT9498973.1 hypothetical protein [Zoogloea sp.]MDD2670375.1 hypothetical protein [Zoogloea sp.]TYC61454.1 hypothetical protein ETQ85_01940 [Zoogloea oleivorans]